MQKEIRLEIRWYIHPRYNYGENMIDFVEHYAQLASITGWLEYVRHQVKTMEQDQTGMYKGLAQAVAQRIKEIDSNNI